MSIIDLEHFHFSSNNEKQWISAAKKQLKGKPLSGLNHLTEEGILLKPIYFPSEGTIPGEIKIPNDIHIACSLFEESKRFNETSRFALDNGQTALTIDLDLTSQFANSASYLPRFPAALHLTEYEHFNNLFENIDLNRTPLLFNAFLTFDTLFTFLKKFAAVKSFNPDKITGSLGADPLSAALLYGGLPVNPDDIFLRLASAFKDNRDFNNLDFITISADIIHNSGGHAIHELSYVLGCIAFYIQQLQINGIKPEHVLPHLRVKLAVANEQFKEIAKLRAMRLLWSNLCRAYEINEIDLKIDVVTSWRYLSDKDIHSNLLRSSSQVFSSIIGGSDSINILPFDLAVKKTDETSRRLARNMAIILLEEGNLKKVNDPSLGSGFIDNLTVKLAENSWLAFQEMEEKGGLFKMVKSGEFQSQIKKNADRQIEEFNSSRKKVIGVNFYQNEKEIEPEKSEKLDAHIAILKTVPFLLDVVPLKSSRLDEGYEQ